MIRSKIYQKQKYGKTVLLNMTFPKYCRTFRLGTDLLTRESKNMSD